MGKKERKVGEGSREDRKQGRSKEKTIGGMKDEGKWDRVIEGQKQYWKERKRERSKTTPMGHGN